MRLLGFLYGLLAYLAFWAALLYGIAFVADVLVPRTIDRGGPAAPVGRALLADGLLLLLFAVQHSVMARRRFKEWWTRIVPPLLERSTYVLVSSLLLLLLYGQWRPLPDPVWEVHLPALRTLLYGLQAAGWGLALVGTFLIGHAYLFGLTQAYAYWRGTDCPPPPLRTPGVYRWIRHPIMLGFVVAFWATPTMTGGHLFFAVVTTGYIVVAVRLEEQDLLAAYGEAYARYRAETTMFMPRPLREGGKGA